MWVGRRLLQRLKSLVIQGVGCTPRSPFAGLFMTVYDSAAHSLESSGMWRAFNPILHACVVLQVDATGFQQPPDLQLQVAGKGGLTKADSWFVFTDDDADGRGAFAVGEPWAGSGGRPMHIAVSKYNLSTLLP